MVTPKFIRCLQVFSLAALSIVIACADQGTSGNPEIAGVTPGEDRASTPDILASMRRVGCRPENGHPRSGAIGIRVPGGEIARFDCTGISGNAIKAGIRDYKDGLARQIDGAAMALTGYTIRHYLGTIRYCDLITETTYMGGVIIGQEQYWDEDSCVWVHYFWDEWEPGSQNDPIPEPYPGGGGPYYPAPDPREPTIDTMPDDDDHICDIVYDMKCFKELTALDSMRIADSVDVYLRPLNDIADPSQRAECDTLHQWLDIARSQMKLYIWRGRTDTFAPGKSPHDGQSGGLGSPSGPNAFHIDPRVLDGATDAAGKRRLLTTLLHESGHSVGGVEHSNNLAQAQAGYPNDEFFRTLHHTSSPCIQ